MRRLSMPLLLIVLLSVPLAVCAQVYKWKDAHGTTHFSDTPPPHGVTYTSVKITADMAATANTNATPDVDNHSKAADADDTAQASSRHTADNPSNRKKLCDNLQANLKLLNGDRPVITKGANGKPQIMSKNYRSRELAKEQKQYQQFCR